ncbi:MAG: restriction endonuclease subunit S, partial [Dysgonamonadaceae bacterium]|nr:restriction endonuclease subunit S [Dysgonamonadaceae bacterium]
MICVSEHERAIILDILKEYAPDCEARAFGSRYKWTSSDSSDLDLALIGKTNMGLSRLGRIRDAFEESELPFRVDVLDWCCLSKEFQTIINSGYEVIYTPDKEKKEQWRKVRLGEVAEIVGGFAFKGQDFSETNGDIRVVKITDITPPTVDYQNTLFIDSSKYDKYRLERYHITNKDFVVAMTGSTIGKIGRLQGNYNAYINQRVAKIKVIDGIDRDFVYYAISVRDFQGYINNHIDSNSVQANISTATIGNFSFSLPPLPTQRAIAATLSCLDDKIELNNRINTNLEAQAQAIFKSWFVDFESFKGSEFVDSELGRIPKGWRVGSLKDVATVTMGQSPKGSSYNESGQGMVFYQG